MMQDLPRFRSAWQFTRWAEDRLLQAARSVTDREGYFRDRGISHGSLHALFLHVMAGQSIWLTSWPGAERFALPDTSPTACADLESIASAWPKVHNAVSNYLTELSVADLTKPVQFSRNGTSLTLPLGETIQHLIDHSAYHRGQLNTLIKLAGGTPARLSYWIYSLTLHPQPSGVGEKDFV